MRKFYLLILSLALFTITSCTKECTCPDEPETHTLTLQPGVEGSDVIVGIRETDGGVSASTNQNHLDHMIISQWTYNAQGHGEGTMRSYLKFAGLSEIPNTATIKSAKLSLYGVANSAAHNVGNSYYPGSPYNTYGDNKVWLRRVTGDWAENTITWNNKPATTDVNKVELPASAAQWNWDVTNIDVTNMVKDMFDNGQLYGFCIQMQTEQIYRAVLFASGEYGDASKRPKLVVEYED